MKIAEWGLIASFDAKKMTDYVRAAIEGGWQPYGNLIIYPAVNLATGLPEHQMVQPVVKYAQQEQEFELVPVE